RSKRDWSSDVCSSDLPGGHQVGGDEDRVQVGGAFQESSHGPFTALVGVVAHGDPVLVHRTQHVMKALQAFHTTGGVLGPGNGGDVLTPDLAQVMDHTASPVAVVGGHVGDVLTMLQRSAAHHQGDTGGGQ